MRIWFFDKITGEILPSNASDKGYDAQPSPREPGKFLDSIYCTQINPPDFGEHETTVFNGSAWEVKADYRELVAWYKTSGDRVEITEIGVEPDKEYTTLSPEGLNHPIFDEGLWREKTEKEIYAKKYESNRDEVITFFRHECELLLESKYYRRELPFKNYHVRADEKSQKILTGYIAEIAFGSRGYPQPWITCENQIVYITDQSEMMDLVNAISQSVEQSIFLCLEVKRNIATASTFEEAWNHYIEFRDAET